MKLTIRDRVILVIATIGIILYIGYSTLWQPGVTKAAYIAQTKAELEGLALDITPLLKRTEALILEEKRLREKVNTMKESGFDNAITKEEFLVLLGDSASKNNAKLISFHDLGVSNSDGLWEATYDMELQGGAYEIGAILQDIQNIEIKCTAGSLSLRQNRDFPFLNRFFDDITRLPWYSPVEVLEETQPTETLAESEIEDSIYEIMIAEPEDEPQTLVPLPSPTPYEDIVELKEKSTEQGLDGLLTQTNYTSNYNVRLLNTIHNTDAFQLGDEMRLAVTLRFIMLGKPNALSGIIGGDV